MGGNTMEKQDLGRRGKKTKTNGGVGERGGKNSPIPLARTLPKILQHMAHLEKSKKQSNTRGGPGRVEPWRLPFAQGKRVRQFLWAA